MKIVSYPSRPLVYDGHNCGPTVLAALIGQNTDSAVDLMGATTAKGWNGYTNIGHIQRALNSVDIEMVKTKNFDGLDIIPKDIADKNPVLLFIQIDGPWVKKGWRSAYNNTHWALFDNGLVMDVNNITIDDIDTETKTIHPRWIDIDFWHRHVMDNLVDDAYNGTGWYIRSGYNILGERK